MQREKAKWDPGGVLLGVDPAGPCRVSREPGYWGNGSRRCVELVI